MKKVLFICNTYYQLLTAIWIKLSLRPEAEADLIFSRHSGRAAEVIGRLKEEPLFRRVKLTEAEWYGENDSRVGKLKSVVSQNLRPDSPAELLWPEERYYDELFFYNVDMVLYRIYDTLYRHNPGLSCCWYEEGIFSYNFAKKYGNRVKLHSALRGLTGGRDLRERLDRYYCFFPELKTDQTKLCTIPPIDRENRFYRELLNRIFDYSPDHHTYGRRYLYFESPYETDGEPIGEAGLVSGLADRVAPENLLIKQHPRDLSSRYQDMGLAVDRNSSVPWEVIMLNQDFSDSVFLSVCSGSCINTLLFGSDKTCVYYLYPMVDAKRQSAHFKEVCGNLEKVLDVFHSRGLCANQKIINQFESDGR